MADDLLAAGLARFDAGAFWHAHEAWEEAWKSDPAPHRDCWKGLIQIAAACYHLQRGNRRPVAWLLGRARHHLTTHDPVAAGSPWPFERELLLELIEEVAAAAPGEPLPQLAACLRERQPGGGDRLPGHGCGRDDQKLGGGVAGW